MADRSSASDMYTNLAKFFVGKSYFPLIFLLFIGTLLASIYLSYIDFMTSVEGYRMTGFQMFGEYEMYAAGFVPQAWQVLLGLSTMGILATGGDSRLGPFSVRTSRVLFAATGLLFLVDLGTDVYFKINGDFSNIPLVIAATAVSFAFFTIGSEVMLVFSFSATMAMWKAGGKSIGDVIETVFDGALDLLAAIVRIVGNIVKRILGVFVRKDVDSGRPGGPLPQSAPKPPQFNPSLLSGTGGGGPKPPGGQPQRPPDDLQAMMRQQQAQAQAQSQRKDGRPRRK